ncbi:MAG TPA: T9SS type A sorting domain-containing protein, partial [Chitinophagales bacterium]|nr:T9SS type A sorting domain-containing protein [Chitinophagales bacterium]
DIFSLFPNPATEQVTLASTLLQEVHFTIYTLDGRFIESGTFTGSKVCGIAHYTPGLYLVQLQADGQQQTIKWVVE